MKRKTLVAVLALILLALSGCSSKDTPMSGQTSPDKQNDAIGEVPRPTGQVVFHVTYVLPSGKAAKPAAVDTMTAYVYESGGTKIAEKNLEKVGDRRKASILVSAGNNRRVDVVAYDGGLVSWLGSDLDVDVVAGQTTTAEVTMQYTIPILADLTASNLSGSYTVSWTEISGSTNYIVEENGSIAYSGQGTSLTTSGKTEGSYSYRVKATTEKYGDTPWSATKTVQVGAGGLIDIDIPEPPDIGEESKPVLSVVSPLALTYDYSYTAGGVDVTGEVENSGDVDAHSVVLQLTARNASDTAMDQVSEDIGDVSAGSKVFFSLRFNKSVFSAANAPIGYCDYSLTYDEGGPDTGRVEVE